MPMKMMNALSRPDGNDPNTTMTGSAAINASIIAIATNIIASPTSRLHAADCVELWLISEAGMAASLRAAGEAVERRADERGDAARCFGLGFNRIATPAAERFSVDVVVLCLDRGMAG